MALKRIEAQIKRFNLNPQEGITISPRKDDNFKWVATIQGPKSSPYEGGTFALSVELSSNYPFEPPKITFITKVYHPNIDKHGNISMHPYICSSCLSWWSPALTVVRLLKYIQQFLPDPSTQDSFVPEISKLYDSDRAKFNDIAKQWTKQYARQ